MKMNVFAAAVCLSLITATSGSAATFDFTNTGPDQSTVDFGDFTVSASSTGLVNSGPSIVNQTSNGLAVQGGYFDTQGDQVDGAFFGTETLTFIFDQAVILTGIDFGAFNAVGGWFNSPDTYGLSLDGGATGVLNTDPWAGSELISMFSLTAANGSDWRVKSITYEVPAVPLPAGAVLLLSGLGAFGFARRRKTS